MIVSTATAGAGKYVQIGVGVVYFLSDSKGNIDSSIKLSSELKKENALKYATYVEGKDSQLRQNEKYYQAVSIIKQESKNKANQMYKAENMILYGAPYNIIGSGGKIILNNLNKFNENKTNKLTVEMAEKMKRRNDNYKSTGNPNFYLNHRRLSIRELR